MSKLFYIKVYLRFIILNQKFPYYKSFMENKSVSNYQENDEFNMNNEENDYENLVIRIKEMKTTIALLEKTLFD